MMTSLYREWILISDKISSLMITSTFLFNTFQVNSEDPYNAVNNSIGRSARSNFHLISKFKNDFEKLLPTVALAVLEDFIKENKKFSHEGTINVALKKKEIISLVTNLSLLENEITYYLKDSQIYIKKSVEIAFNHLQRQLIADEFVKQAWLRPQNERGFEKLGGAHLLLHKIWAFKIDAEGERTDLVFTERVDTNDTLYQSVDGLVLTEWKVVKKRSDVQNKIQEAKEQAERYSKGSLASIELSSYRYLVMISEDFVDIERNEIAENGIVYRVINIAYNPKTPSMASKKTA